MEVLRFLHDGAKSNNAFHQIALHWTDVGLDEAVELAHELEIYAYDAYLIACARQRSWPLMTLDRGLLAAARSARIETIEVP